MKLSLTLSKLASITGGTLHAKTPQASFRSFATDSRVLAKGDAFWALKGRNHDAHDFIKEVISGLINKKIDLAKANKPDDKEITKYFTFVTNEKPFTYHQIMAWLLSAINQKSII